MMNYKTDRAFMTVMLGSIVVLGGLFADSAQAAERKGRPRSRTTTVEQTETGRTSTTTVTRDPAAGTRSTDVQYTGPNGKTATVERSTQKTDDGFTHTATATGPNGNTATRSVDRSCDTSSGSKTCTTTVQGTRP